MVVVYLGRTPAYLVNDPELVRRMLVADASAFDKGIQYEKLGALLGQALATTSGIEHRDRRRMMQPAFHHERIAAYAELMRDATLEMTRHWRTGTVVAIDREMRALALTIVAKALCTTELGREAVAIIQTDLPLVLRGAARRVLFSNATMESLPTPGNRRFAAANARLRAVIGDLVATGRASGVDNGDLLSMLLAARDQETGQALDERRIIDEVVNLLFAGTETTGNAMAWMWHVIAARPHLADQLRAESKAKTKAETETETETEMSTAGTDLARRLARETARLYPPPWLVSRRARQAVRLGGCQLPAGAQVLFSPYAIQRDPAYYRDPETFDPDRWLPGHRSAPPRLTYLTFGAGPQNCVGEGFAMLEMATVAATISANWRLHAVGTTRERVSATLVPSQLRVRVEAVSQAVSEGGAGSDARSGA